MERTTTDENNPTDIECIGDQEISDGFLPLNLKLKAKLLKQNIEGLSLTNKQVGHVRCKFIKAGKFTIVELARNGKHYHGLSSRANCDSGNWFTGVAVAFNRAFNDMVESEGLFIQSKRKAEHDELMEMIFGNATAGKNKMVVVSTPFISDDIFEILKHCPPAVGPTPTYLR